MDILFASSNEHKKKELSLLLAPHTIHLPSEFGISFDCEENGETFNQNAYLKAHALFVQARHLNMPVLADDSGLLVDALPGQLGVKTNRFGAEDGGPLLSAEQKNKLLLEKLKNRTDRTARFVTCLTLIFPNGIVITAEGQAEGYILDKSIGEQGFGYDPVFFNNEANMPAGLMTTEQKNLYGHRGKASRALLKSIDTFNK